MSLLPAIELQTSSTPPNAAVVWLHGLGASGHDFEPIVPVLGLPAAMAVRFIFPHAPAIPITVNSGYVMPAWYDILDLTLERQLDTNQLLASADQVAALVERELARGIASDRIVLAGFSQGGAVAYQTALTFPKPLAGLLAMSTYFATAGSIHQHPANRQLPIELMHGSSDPVVPEVLAQQALASLRGMGHTPGYTRYAMEHEVCPEQIRDISRILQNWLGT